MFVGGLKILPFNFSNKKSEVQNGNQRKKQSVDEKVFALF